MEVAIFSDLHLGLQNDSVEWTESVFKWIDSMVSSLKKKNINTIFFLGDWFHNRASITSVTLNVSADILEKLKDFDIWLFPGNHDLYYAEITSVSSISMMKGYPNIHFIDKPLQTNFGNKTVTFCPWGFDPLDPSIKSTDYLFGHFAINTFRMTSAGTPCEDGLTLSDLLKKFSKIFSGHFHSAQKRVYTAGMVQYIGSPFQQNYGECGEEKGFIILNFDTDKYHYVYNNVSPKFEKLELSKLINKDFDKLDDLLSSNFVRICIDKNITDDDVQELIKLISTYKPLECDIDWDDNGFSITVNAKTDFETLELEQALTEFTNLLDIAQSKEVLKYIKQKFKQVNESN